MQITRTWTLVGFIVSLLSLTACSPSGSSQLNGDSYPICSSAATDPDKDGWGWENNHSCRTAPLCSSAASDPDGDGWGWENKQSCRVAPTCANASSDPDGDGWGWENNKSCRVASFTSSRSVGQVSVSTGGTKDYETTYYPFKDEHYFKTSCGDANSYGGMYFAVTEQSPVWAGSCDNDSWAVCEGSDCLGKWDRMPSDVKRYDSNGQKMVREPRCDVPCGRKFNIANADRSKTTTAVIYDACPSQHWNNRFKEVNEGKNPCAKGALHVDLRKPLYLFLNNGLENGNIQVLIDTNPVP